MQYSAMRFAKLFFEAQLCRKMKRKMKLARCMQHDDSVHDSGTRRKGYRRNPGVFLKHEDRVPPSAGAWRGGASPVSRIRAHGVPMQGSGATHTIR